VSVDDYKIKNNEKTLVTVIVDDVKKNGVDDTNNRTVFTTNDYETESKHPSTILASTTTANAATNNTYKNNSFDASIVASSTAVLSINIPSSHNDNKNEISNNNHNNNDSNNDSIVLNESPSSLLKAKITNSPMTSNVSKKLGLLRQKRMENNINATNNMNNNNNNNNDVDNNAADDDKNNIIIEKNIELKDDDIINKHKNKNLENLANRGLAAVSRRQHFSNYKNNNFENNQKKFDENEDCSDINENIYNYNNNYNNNNNVNGDFNTKNKNKSQYIDFVNPIALKK
jgi:hypothetical protein